ncbi:MAG: autotransporter domain-containing protein [Pseudomonadota bacterium]
MNTSYRNFWNPILGTWVAVSELTRARGKRSRGGRCGRPLASLSIRLGMAGLFAGLVSPSVMAACTPVNPSPGATVVCTGIPSTPLFLNTYSSAVNGLTVNVIANTQLNASTGDPALSLTGDGITLTNNGTIDPSSNGPLQSLSGGVVMGNANSSVLSITNAATGTITGTTGLVSGNPITLTGMALNVSNGTNGTTSIVNNGLINSASLSGISAVPADAAVVAVQGGSTVDMRNGATGAITGRVAFEASSTGNSFVNAGVINGSVSLGASGGNTFTAITGSVINPAGGSASSLAVAGNSGLTFAATGTVDGGAGGTNTLVLQNTLGVGGGSSNAGTASSATYVNFNKLIINSGTWTLTGPLVSDSTTLNGGVALFNDSQAFGSGVLTGNGGAILASSAAINLTNAITLDTGGLTVQGSNAMTLSGVISGSGGLTKIGVGELTISGANDYIGGTTLGGIAASGGTVVLGNDLAFGTGTVTLAGTTSLSTPGTITLNNAFTLNNATTTTGTGALTLVGDISGSGWISQSGTGSLTLSGNNSNYSGAISLNAGTLRVGSNTALGTNAITVNGSASLDSTSSVTLTNAMTLNANLNVLGSNALGLGGVIDGTGSLTKTGTGNLTLSGTNTYTGTTTVNAGLLSVNGSIANSAVTVNSGAALGGSGTVGNLTVMSGGILAPGNSIGELTVNGNATLAAGSIFRVEADDAGHADKLLVNGSATINGGTVDVQASAGTYAANTTYTILNATGGRTGNFDNVTSNLAFLTSTLSYDTNNVFLNLARNNVSYSNVAVTPNQIATSTSLQGITGATGDMGNVITAVTGLSAEQARASYDAMSGASLSAMSRAAAGFSAGVGSQMRARLAAVSGSSTSASAFGTPVQLTGNDHVYDLFSSASTASNSSPRASSASGLTGLGASADTSLNSYGRGFWLRGYGNYQSTSSDGNAVASTVRSNGLSVGFDTEVSDGLIVGVAGTFGKSSLRLDSNDTGRSRDRAIAAYASYKTGPWNFNGSANFAFNSSNMARQITVGALTRTATSAFDGNTASVYGEATYDIHMQNWTLQPLAALSLSRSKTDGFTEQGAGALNLQVAGQTTNSVKTLFGAKAQFEVGQVKLEPRLAWGHEFGDANVPMTMQFAGSAAPSFLISGVKLPRDSVIAGLGLSSNISKRSNSNLSVFADIQGEYNSRQSNVALLVGIRSRW